MTKRTTKNNGTFLWFSKQSVRNGTFFGISIDYLNFVWYNHINKEIGYGKYRRKKFGI